MTEWTAPSVRPALDLTRYHARYRHGDVTAYLTWWLAEDSGPIPCLVLVPTHARAEHILPCCIMINDAWVWSEEIGDPQQAARMAMAMAEALGLGALPSAAIRVRTIVADHLGDLMHMPPMPNDMRQNVVLGEVKVTAREADRVVSHGEWVERI